MTAAPVAWLGRVEMRPMPVAILTGRGTVRTRRRVPNGCQRYPAGAPGDWSRAGHVSAGVWCIACHHHADLKLDALPPLPWSRIGRAMLCTGCGMPGFVDIKPNWRDHDRHVTPFTSRWRADPLA